MSNVLNVFRYFVLGLFVICNAIIATSAVWNISIVQPAGAPLSSALRTDAFMIFVGSSGLILIFPILFCELANKDIFFVRTWFECGWVALFCILELAGAAATTATGVDQICNASLLTVLAVSDNSACISSQILQAFTWICALFLICYFLLLFITSLFKSKDDPTIWHCTLRKFPWMSAHFKLGGSAPSSPSGIGRKISVPRLRTKAPTIAAPRPRKPVDHDAIRQAVLSYRSGLSLEYEIEHFRVKSPDLERPEERPVPPVPVGPAPEHLNRTTREATAATFSHSLYPQHVQQVMPIKPQTQLPRNVRLLPPSPPPQGNWPQLDAPLRRPGDKRKAVPEMSQKSPEKLASASIRRLPYPATSPSSIPNPISLVRAPPPAAIGGPITPPSAFISHRSRPSGPRRPSLDEKRPSPLDLSQISSHRPKGRPTS